MLLERIVEACEHNLKEPFKYFAGFVMLKLIWFSCDQYFFQNLLKFFLPEKCNGGQHHLSNLQKCWQYLMPHQHPARMFNDIHSVVIQLAPEICGLHHTNHTTTSSLSVLNVQANNSSPTKYERPILPFVTVAHMPLSH